MTESVLKGIALELSRVRQSLGDLSKDTQDNDAFSNASRGLKKIRNLFQFVEYPMSAGVVDALSGAMTPPGRSPATGDGTHTLEPEAIIAVIDTFAETVNVPEEDAGRQQVLQQCRASLLPEQALDAIDDAAGSSPDVALDTLESATQQNSGDYVYQVFKQEIYKELDTVRRHYAAWRRSPNKSGALAATRASVGVLENSAGLVGADDLADFARQGGAVFSEQVATADENMSSLDLYIETLGKMMDSVFKAKAVPTEQLTRLAVFMDEAAREVSASSNKKSKQADNTTVQDTTSALGSDIGEEIEAEKIAPYIFDIYKEESYEELDSIKTLFPQWRRNFNNTDMLADFRRSFHTLKGTSHVAGVQPLADFARASEFLLNRVIERDLSVSDQLFSLFEQIVDTLEVAIERLFSRQGLPVATMARLQELANIFPQQPEPIESVEADSEASADKSVGQLVEDSTEEIERADEQTANNVAQDEIVLCAMDEQLYEVYLAESELNLQVVKAALDSLEGSAEVPDELLRALHSLHGSSNVAGAEVVAKLSGAMNKMLLDVNASGEAVTEDDASLLKEYLILTLKYIQLINVKTTKRLNWESLLDAIYARHNDIKAGFLVEPAYQESEPVADGTGAAIETFLDNTAQARADFYPSFDDWRDASDNEAARNGYAQTLTSIVRHARDTGFTDLARLADSMLSIADGKAQVSDQGFELSAQALDVCEAVFDKMHLNRLFDIPLDQVDSLVAQMDAYQQNLCAEAEVPAEPEPQAAVAEVPAAALELPAEPAAEQTNSEVMGLFLEEADELMGSLDSAYDAWVLEPESRQSLDMQLRQLHTLKGNARLTNLTGIADLSHVVESLFEHIIAGDIEPSSNVQELVRSTYDVLQQSVDDLYKNAPPPVLDNVIETVRGVIKGEEWKGGALAVQVSQAPSAASNNAATGSSRAKPSLRKERERVDDRRVRVSGNLLDKLIKQSGEMNIEHRDLEVKSNAERFNLAELTGTIARLQRQLAMLDVETDAKIVARTHSQEAQDGVEFDPLEMDHYSTLQQISRSIAETVDDLAEIGGMMNRSLDERDAVIVSGNLRARELHDRLLSARQQPIGQLFARLERVVRMSLRETGKQAEFEMTGQDVRIDSNTLHGIVAPLEHLLRNSVAHGIELPADRPAHKGDAGRVGLRVTQDSARIELSVFDNGKGLDAESIRKRAIAKGLLSPDVAVSEQDLFRFISTSGFSTTDSVSKLAGRGVGMDAVINSVRQLGGTLSIASKPGEGSSFTIRLPASRSIAKALLVKAAGDTYAIPHGSVERITKVPSADVLKAYEGEQSNVNVEGKSYRLHHLGTLLGLSTASDFSAKEDAGLLLLDMAGEPVAVHVDHLVGTAEIQIRSAGEQLRHLPWFVDSTILASGDIALVLDIATLLTNKATAQVATDVEIVSEQTVQRERPLVMVVDDSLTVRKVTTHTLERHDLDVVTAKDGVDAISVLQDVIPDVMLLDVEMPRMNGFELARQMGNTEAFKSIPIIMITSRTGDKHRNQAMELGVKQYLGKPFNEAELLGHIRDLVGEQHDA